MNKLYYCKIANANTGLCNQLFSLVTGIILAVKLNKSIIIVDNFQKDFEKNITCPISEIINIDKFNIFLESNYDIHIIDKNDVKLKINSVYYGNDEYQIDITKEIVEKCYNNNTFCINNRMDLNLLAENDPVPFHRKTLFMNYSINEYNLYETFEEEYCHLKNSIIFDMNLMNFQYTFLWMDAIDKNMFDNILKNIVFEDVFYEWSDCFIKNNKINTNEKINVLHLRLEDDAVIHWARQNKMNPESFRSIIENKYINIIKKCIDKEDNNIILSYSTENKVIDFLKENDYKYYITDKIIDDGREINALRDFIIGNICNNIFIGNFNLDYLNGSTLSYYLIKKLQEKNITFELVDLDRIIQPHKEIKL
jgi:hypothetical protein